VLDIGYHYLIELSEQLPPRARFTWIPQYPDTYEPVYFDASGSFDGDGGAIVLYEWDWDNDGVYDESHTDPTATHTWDISDDHLVTLRVWDEEDEYDTLTVSLPIFPNPIYVPDDYLTIQEAINTAVDWDSVIVRPGVYYEHDIDFLGKAITVMSTDPTDWEVVASTIVDANAQGSVFNIYQGEDTTSVLTGLTIRGGYGLVGGGIRCVFSSPTIARNVITGNTATDDGGGIHLAVSDAIVINNEVTNNMVLDTWGTGGGIRCANTYPTGPRITNNVISDNTANNGGGITIYSSFPILTGNTITGNSASNGGGIECESNSNATVTNTVLWNNTASYGKEILISSYDHPSTFTISYSDVQGGLSSVWLVEGCTLNWGDGMIDSFPSFKDDGYHLKAYSPCRNTGDPDYIAGESETDIDNERRVIEGRVDIGADEIRALHVEDEKPPVINTSKEAKSLD
jgi:parallel beta-helix repeat protein